MHTLFIIYLRRDVHHTNVPVTEVQGFDKIIGPSPVGELCRRSRVGEGETGGEGGGAQKDSVQFVRMNNGGFPVTKASDPHRPFQRLPMHMHLRVPRRGGRFGRSYIFAFPRG